MALEELKQRIINDANERAARIRAEAERKAHEMLLNAEERAHSLRETQIKHAEQKAKALKENILGTARLEAKKELLAAKRALIEKVIENAKRAISEMPEKEYLKFIERQLMHMDMPSSECEIIIGSNDMKRITSGYLRNIEKMLLEKKGEKVKLLLSSTPKENISGGFIIKAKDVEINSSVEAVVKFKRESIEREIANMLFGD